MQLIKDKQVIENKWRFLPDDAVIETGAITVSASRWRNSREQLLKHTGTVGIRLSPSNSIDEIATDLNAFGLIELDFPDFADGRLFTFAWLLRNRYNYQGEIRATGHFMSGQVFYLSRVGVNAFALEKDEDVNTSLEALNDFSVQYQ